MEPFLNIHENTEEEEMLKCAYRKDPVLVCDNIRKELQAYTVAAEMEAQRLQSTEQIAKLLREILDSIADFEEKLPPRRSLFRSGEDARAMYVQLCPLMERMTQYKTQLQEAGTAFGFARNRLRQTLAGLHKIEWQCIVLGLEGECIRSVLQMQKQEKCAQCSVVKQIEHVSALLYEYNTKLLSRAIHHIGALSDAEHDGRSCDHTGVLAALAAVKQETNQIKQNLFKTEA